MSGKLSKGSARGSFMREIVSSYGVSFLGKTPPSGSNRTKWSWPRKGLRVRTELRNRETHASQRKGSCVEGVPASMVNRGIVSGACVWKRPSIPSGKDKPPQKRLFAERGPLARGGRIYVRASGKNESLVEGVVPERAGTREGGECTKS